MRDLSVAWIELHEIMRQPWTADIEGDVFVSLRLRFMDGRFEPIEIGSRHERRKVRNLLLAANRQCDEFGAGRSNHRHDLRGSRIAVLPQRLVNHLAKANSVVVRGRSAAVKSS